MSETDQEKTPLEEVSDEELGKELEKRIEKKAEAWGNKLEEKCDTFEKKLPFWINALMDAACFTVFILLIIWIVKVLSWIADIPSIKIFILIFAAIFVASLVYRAVIKSK